MVNIEDCGWCNKLRNWAIDTATILFDDNHNDLRALPKTVRLQILVVVVGHLGIIFAMYVTFKQFHNAQKKFINYKFNGYHSAGRTRGFMIGRDKKGNPYKVYFDPNDPGGEHE